MLMTRPAHGYAIACSSFPRRSIALLNASIILSYIMLLSRNVPVTIAISLIGKRVPQFVSRNFSERTDVPTL